MPTLDQAFDFVRDPQTSIEQLQLACEILKLDQAGDREEVLARLDKYLITYNPNEPIVCLNPTTSDHG